jgi:dihydrofolate reductase
VTANSGLHPQIVLIVAVAENGVIGQGNAIPWRLKSDMQRLKAMTMGKPVIMGRKTFASLRRPLPGRTNIVITRDANFSAAGAVVTTSLAAAFAVAQGDALRRLATEIAVIGGTEIYTQSMDLVDRLEITEVHARPEGDTYFPPIDPTEWQEIARQPQLRADGDMIDFSYVTYKRHSRDPARI